MQFSWNGVAFSAAMLLLLPASASAGSEDDFMKRLMAREAKAGAIYACFDRVYDAAHLASHPKQNVETMVLMAKYDLDAPREKGESPHYELRIGIKFRQAKRMKETDGACTATHPDNDQNGPVTAHCGVACDGGSIDVNLKDNDAMLVSIPAGARTWTPGADDKQDEADSKVLHGGFGPDDKLFRLDRADVKHCLTLASDKDEKAQINRQR